MSDIRHRGRGCARGIVFTILGYTTGGSPPKFLRLAHNCFPLFAFVVICKAKNVPEQASEEGWQTTGGRGRALLCAARNHRHNRGMGGGRKACVRYPKQIPKSPMTFHVNFLSICRQRGRPLTVNHIITLLKHACHRDLLG